jgi:hypothetical protein
LSILKRAEEEPVTLLVRIVVVGLSPVQEKKTGEEGKKNNEIFDV